MARRSFLFAAAVGLVIVGAGCSSSTTDSGTPPATFKALLAEARQSGNKTQVKVLQDGAVSFDELNGSLDNYFGCLTKSGLTYKFNGTNPVDGWRPLIDVNWRGLSDNDGMSKDSLCMQKNLLYVEYGYEMLNPEVMDPKLMAGVQTCLSQMGVAVNGDERNVKDLLPLGAKDQKRADAVQTCVFSAGSDYPGGIIFGY